MLELLDTLVRLLKSSCDFLYGTCEFVPVVFVSYRVVLFCFVCVCVLEIVGMPCFHLERYLLDIDIRAQSGH